MNGHFGINCPHRAPRKGKVHRFTKPIAKNSSTRRSKSLTCILLHLVTNKEKESKEKRYELDLKVCLCAIHDPGKAQHFRAEEAWSAGDQTTL